MTQQKILIIDQGLLSKEIEANSNEELLIDVIHVNLPNKKYPYSFFDKYINILNRFFLNSPDYPKDREYHFISNSFFKDLKKGLQKKYYDYVLITRPDNFNSKFLLEVSKVSKNIIGYVWDSMSDDKYKKLIKTRSNFKYLYCYDQNSIINYPDLKLEYTTNFYYHTKDFNLNLYNKNIFLSYIGNNLDARKELILNILQNIGITSSNKDKIDITLVERTLKMSSDINIFDNFKITNQKIATEEYLKILSNSFISLDLIPSFNNGFSFRLFEASHTMTKLITTNQNAAQLQFYHPDNIFIYNDETKHLLTDFVKKPYYKINASLIEYYRIDNWLKRVLKLS